MRSIFFYYFAEIEVGIYDLHTVKFNRHSPSLEFETALKQGGGLVLLTNYNGGGMEFWDGRLCQDTPPPPPPPLNDIIAAKWVGVVS